MELERRGLKFGTCLCLCSGVCRNKGEQYWGMGVKLPQLIETLIKLESDRVEADIEIERNTGKGAG